MHILFYFCFHRITLWGFSEPNRNLQCDTEMVHISNPQLPIDHLRLFYRYRSCVPAISFFVTFISGRFHEPNVVQREVTIDQFYFKYWQCIHVTSHDIDSPTATSGFRSFSTQDSHRESWNLTIESGEILQPIGSRRGICFSFDQNVKNILVANFRC